MKAFLTHAATFATIALATITFAKTAHSAINTTDRAKIETIVHDYILKNPDIIIQAVQNYQRKQYEQVEKTFKNTEKVASKFASDLFHRANDPAIGNPNAKITVVEFFDYQCPHCVAMAPVIADLKGNPNVRIVFKDFPVRGPMSELAAKAAIAANAQGKYYDFSHALLTLNKQLDENTIYETGQKVGLNVEQLKEDMKKKPVQDQLDNNIKLAEQLKLFGTPAFFISNKDNKKIRYFPGRIDKNKLQSTIQSIQ